MYSSIARRMTVTDSKSEESSAISLQAGNAVQIDWTIVSVAGSPTVKIEVQETGDLGNWQPVSSDASSAIGFRTFTSPNVDVTAGGDPGARIAASAVRVVVSVSSGTGSAIVAIGANVAKL